MACSLDRAFEIPWVRKGAFAFLEYETSESFKKELSVTAEPLLLKYQLTDHQSN